MKRSAYPFVLLFLYLCMSGIPGHINAQPRQLVEVLKREAIELDSSDLSSDGNVHIVRSAIDTDFQVLGIGEQSHGTSEFFTARWLLVKALAADHAFTKIGLEAPMAEVEKLNDYLYDGRGDLKAIVRSFRLYGYECEEFVSLVDSVGRIAKTRGQEIRFFGFDMQSPFQSLQNLREFAVSGEVSDSLKNLLHYYELLNNEVYNHSLSPGDFNDLKTLSDQVLGKMEPVANVNAPIRKSINNYRQFLVLNDSRHAHAEGVQSEIRDSLMAVNVLAEAEPGKKMIIMAHNAHLQKTPNIFSKSVGTLLSQTLGAAYRCIAQTTSHGFYTTFNPQAGRITDKNDVLAGGPAT